VTAVRTAQARRYSDVIDDRFREGTSMHRLATRGRIEPLADATERGSRSPSLRSRAACPTKRI
jgi:hypothetical protein